MAFLVRVVDIDGGTQWDYLVFRRNHAVYQLFVVELEQIYCLETFIYVLLHHGGVSALREDFQELFVT